MMWQPGVTLADMEKMVILRALRHFQGNKTHTANALGIAVRTLQNKLHLYGVEKNEGLQAEAGLHVESSSEDSEELTMPMQQRQEVQEMPSKLSASGNSNRGAKVRGR